MSTDRIPFEGTVDAPAFPEGLEWFNTAAPLTLSQLSGKLVLLGFWTYSNLACIASVYDLRKLADKYRGQLVIVGIHCGKFASQRDGSLLTDTLARHELDFPVCDDKEFKTWKRYGIAAWPTCMLINPRGRIIGKFAGERVFELFDPVISKSVAYFSERQGLRQDNTPTEVQTAGHPRPLLAFPGKICAHAESKRLFFTDSHNHRIVIVTFEGAILDCIGAGQPGFADGDCGVARFNTPQGLCLSDDAATLYVADTFNHRIRRVDLATRTVTTLAGTGTKSRKTEDTGGPALEVDLNQPWDLALADGILYIAMAGSHQIWALHLDQKTCHRFAGTGQQDLADGLVTKCKLAQTCGLTTDGQSLYFVDSEISALRRTDLFTDGYCETLIGKGLFEFGDADGHFPDARLQHPEGIAYDDETSLFIADTFNQRIRKFDLNTRTLSTFVGSGRRGNRDGVGGSASFNEPAGLCVADGKLFICDTNNHLIRVCNLASRRTFSMSFSHIERLLPESLGSDEPVRRLETRPLAAGNKFLELVIRLPTGFRIHPRAPSKLRFESDNANVVVVPSFESGFYAPIVNIPVVAWPGAANVRCLALIFYCDEFNEALCYYRALSLEFPVRVEPSAPGLAAWEIDAAA